MIVKQGEIRSNIKKYFDMAYDGEPVVVPRKEDKNVIILSEQRYNNLLQLERLMTYYSASRGAMPHTLPNDATVVSGQPEIKSYPDSTDLKSDNIDRLSVFRSLKKGWNGNGAEAFDPALIDRVEKIIDQLSIQPEIFPSAAGTIELEYTNSRRDFMGIEIGSCDTAEVFLVLYNGKEDFEEIQAEGKTIDSRVRRFYE